MADFPTSRRGFLQAAAFIATTGAWPSAGRAASPSRFQFVGDRKSWPVEDPCAWALANHASLPVLESARERLGTLTPADGERTLKVVLRRCPLNLMEVDGNAVTIHQWTATSRVDLRWFFKAHGLARRDVSVTVRLRKKEQSVLRQGDSYLYWDAVDDGLPLDRFATKRANRFIREPDDNDPAPGTRSGYGWEGVPGDMIPWRTLKNAWRESADVLCPNCDTPAIMTNFGYRQISFFNRAGAVVHACAKCRRRKVQKSDSGPWGSRAFAENLEPENRPVRIYFHGAHALHRGGHVAPGTDRINS